MSILLDALKKSEEQRQLGKTPEIHDPADHVPAGRRKAGLPWIPLFLVAVAAAVISWYGWQQFAEPEMDAESESAEVAQPRRPQVMSRQAAGQPEQEALEQDIRGQDPQPEARTPIETFSTTEEDSPDDALVSGETEQNRQQLAEQFSQFQKPADEPERKPVPEQEADQAPAPAEEERTLASPASPEEPASMEPHISQPISYWELPQSVRGNLPEFHITVMVYAEEPEHRFLLLNGQRLVEGDSAGGVELEEIRRDGAVFRYRTYRFLVKG